MILGTAGHVDHGKTALVEALTGRRMDRLAEERARGITIDLNFAPLPLGDGLVAGVVDVPGHEDFVRTMVAGAGGVDCALLVVAADEGIRPQTREHAAVLAALRVQAGVVAVTKADLVGADRLGALCAELDQWLSGSSVRWTPAMPVSSRQGAGLDALKGVLVQAALRVPRRDALDAFRMPVDRAFSVPGTGTVVTGSIWSGAVEAGSVLRLLPGGEEARVKTLEMHGIRHDRVEAGSRAAVGLAGVDRLAVGRGSDLVDPSLPWAPTSALDVNLDLLPDGPRRLDAHSQVQLLLGTAAVSARIAGRKPGTLDAPDQARLLLDRPIVARGGDRFVLRMPAPLGTIGGGGVLDPHPPRRGTAWPVVIDLSDPGARLRVLLAREGGGVSAPELALRTGLSTSKVDRLLTEEPAVRNVAGEWLLREVVDRASEKAVTAVAGYHESHPERPGMAHAELVAVAHRHPGVAAAALGDLVGSGRIVVESGRARLSGHRVQLAGGPEGVDRVVRAIVDGGLTPSGLQELRARFPGVDVPGALRQGVAAGTLRMVRGDWAVGQEALDGFVGLLRGFGHAEVSVAALRTRTGLSRKFLIPLLEWADRSGFTRRVGDARRLT